QGVLVGRRDGTGFYFGQQLILQLLERRLVGLGRGRRDRGHDSSKGWSGDSSRYAGTRIDRRAPGLNEVFRPPPRLLPGVAPSHSETSGNKNPSRARPNHRQKVGMAQAIPNILVVEDDRETRSLIAKYLRNNACNVATAADGREMARAMTDRRVDLLILDVMLPGEDGLTLCRKVRAQSQTPIIMLTARGEDVDRILGLEMGADDYLAKPFNPRELLARINAVLRRQAIAHTASATEGATALLFAG